MFCNSFYYHQYAAQKHRNKKKKKAKNIKLKIRHSGKF